VDWINLAQDRAHCLVLVTAVINLLIQLVNCPSRMTEKSEIINTHSYKCYLVRS
jgi:hypothetical protein